MLLSNGIKPRLFIQNGEKKKLIKLKEDESKEEDITQSRNPNENILNLNKDIESIKDNNSFKSSSSRKNSTHSIKGNKSPRSPKSPSLILTNNKKLSQFASTFNQKTPRNNIINDVLFKDNEYGSTPTILGTFITSLFIPTSSIRE